MPNTNPADPPRQISLYDFCAVLPMSFCVCLNELCEEYSLSLESLAELTGIKLKTIKQHLNGNLPPSELDLLAYAEAFGMSREQFGEVLRYWSASGKARVELTIDAIKLADQKAVARNTPTGEWIESLIRDA